LIAAWYWYSILFVEDIDTMYYLVAKYNPTEQSAYYLVVRFEENYMAVSQTKFRSFVQIPVITLCVLGLVGCGGSDGGNGQ
jgi:hypothetical protein